LNKENFILKLDSIGKHYFADAGLKINVLEDIGFEIPFSNEGAITSILAPFGSGKSTLLKIISGVIKKDSGEIYFGDSQNKNVPLIPEKPSSFPWMNVKQNIEFGLNLSKNKKYSVDDLISLTGLTGYGDHHPDNKSFGFRFRISLARAMALNPSLILIDDSFKLMKKETKEEIHQLIYDISFSEKINFIIATTNLVEAIQLSDIIFLMSAKPGRIIRRIETGRRLSPDLANVKSEKFASQKADIEKAFHSVHSIKTINYSV
jgi:ABC-type nitrate/sulfonate/bicarbonate transport system ATPase subunit